ncbi:zinc-ribbon domain-containing protein [Streptomyces sp.]|uniref:zinc-ribbon domain-containing protein n=1 Tax=Streptomyces sp. TaxID=1931 RepID=UPI0039C96F78
MLDEYDFQHEENPAELPYTETTKSPRSVWWCCLREDEHRWRTSFHNRHVIGTKYPRCGKKGVSSTAAVNRSAGARRYRSAA